MTVGDDNSEASNFEYLSVAYEKGKRHGRLLAYLAGIAFLLSIPALWLWPRSYTATATIAPTSGLSSNELSLGGAMSALSALGGKSLLGGNSVSPFDMYIDILSSKQLARQLAEKDHFLQIIFGAQWDPHTNNWRPHNSFPHFVKVSVLGLFGFTVKEHPDVDDLSGFLAGHLAVASKESETSPLSAITTLKFTYRDPKLSVQMLNTILSEADSLLRVSRRTDVRARIAYLGGVLPTVTLAEQRQALISLLSSQEEEYTVIEADKRYAFTLLDQPYASSAPTSPFPPLIIAGFLFFSVLVWIVLVLALPETSWILQTTSGRRSKVYTRGRAEDGMALRAPSGAKSTP